MAINYIKYLHQIVIHPDGELFEIETRSTLA